MSSKRRVSLDVVNSQYASIEGVLVNCVRSFLRIELNRDYKFLRVSNEVPRKKGRFLARVGEIKELEAPENVRLRLALKDKSCFVSEVTVPKGTVLYAGPVAPQEAFGAVEDLGFQYFVKYMRDIDRFTFKTMLLKSFLSGGYNKNITRGVTYAFMQTADYENHKRNQNSPR